MAYLNIYIYIFRYAIYYLPAVQMHPNCENVNLFFIYVCLLTEIEFDVGV